MKLLLVCFTFNFFLLSTVLTDFINLSDYPCYKPKSINYRNGRIVGGFNAVKQETVYMAAVTRSGGNIFCGASIISEKLLIIAAHCLCNSQNKVIKPTQIKVYVGVNKASDIRKLENDDDDKPIEVFLNEIIIHPEYTCGEKTSDSDIALLKLKKHIAFSENVHSLCLTTDSSKISSIGLVSGYGMNNENYSVAVKPDILQAAHLPVWNNQDCRDRYANKSYSISERQICAGGTNGIDSCYSDSGGPLIDFKTGALVGIISTGIGCARQGLPGIYIRVSKFTNWILTQVNLP